MTGEHRTARREDGVSLILLGLKGGLFATITMTAFRMPISKSLPPTAHFCAQYLGGSDDPDEFHVLSLSLHLLYGLLGGALFAWRFSDLHERDPPRAETIGLLAGFAYGLLASVFGTHVVLSRALGIDLDSDEILVFHAGHGIYGATLGGYVASELSHEE